MKHLSWILTIPVMIVAVVFAVSNREAAALNLWPFGITVEAPLFILVLGSGLFGVVLGGAITWLSAGKKRQRAREAEFRASSAERELHYLQRKLDQAAPAGGATVQRPANDAAAHSPGRNALPAGRH